MSKKIIGLIGGENISKYSVAHLVWGEILRINKKDKNIEFKYFPVVKNKDFKTFITSLISSDPKLCL